MSLISFDILFQNQIENDSIKLLPDCEFQQLKLMICGKYKIYDLNNVYIYYNNNLIIDNDSTKLKNIFKHSKIKLEISETPLIKNDTSLQINNYLCGCETFANYVCDKCNEFLCEVCTKNKKHSSHINKIIKISEYKNYFQSNKQEISKDLEKNILNDEPYLFFQFWNYDINSELSKINNTFEFVKKDLEDIKQILIDYILSFEEYNKYEELKKNIESINKQYININIDNDLNIILEEKKKISQLINETFTWYAQIKNQLFNYHKSIKEIQLFNQLIIKETKDKYNLIQKKYDLTENAQNDISNGNILEKNNNNLSNEHLMVNGRNYNFAKKKNKTEIDNFNKFKNNNYTQKVNIGLNKNNFNLSSPLINAQTGKEKIIFKLKDKYKIICFSLKNQTFKEKMFIDKSNFTKEISEANDSVIQLNFDNKLLLLIGKNSNKIYYYDYNTNTLNYLGNTLYEHNYGAIVYCSKYGTIYLLGGAYQNKCEISNLYFNKKLDWKALPSLNEERQKFAAIYFNEFIYVFFGYSIKKGNNLCSIERINVNINDKFEIIYVNEQITLCSLACSQIIDENEKNKSILLLGGFDGKKFLDTSLILDVKEMKMRDWDIIIPNINKYNNFLFHNECVFVDYNDDIKLIFDMNNNVHLLTKDSYELFSEAQ
jgi:hypothetical protein